MSLILIKRRTATLASMLFVTWTQAAEPVLESVIVTGHVDKPNSINKPFSIIQSDEINTTGASTITEALQYQPGISATRFGPNASRPIVRGQDSDRIKVLRNSAATVDVSALSFDHALPADPFSFHQVEILRGTAALAYGGNAVGGVINLIDSRIARKPIEGIEWEINGLRGGAANQSAHAVQLDAGLGKRVSIHLDGFKRTTRDLKTPVFTNPDNVTGKQVQNSSSKSDGAAIGASFQTQNGYIGLSAEQYDNEYGVPKSLDVRIKMDNTRHALEGEQAFDHATLDRVKYRVAQTNYRHQEFEDSMPATLFLNKGIDGRVELAFQKFALAHFNVSINTGLQFERTDFSAVGTEAFVPSTSTDQTGLFTIFRAGRGGKQDSQFELGLRVDQVNVNAASSGLSTLNGPVAGAGVATGPAIERAYTPHSLSIGYNMPVGNGWSLGASLSRTERAPSGFELYADGVHVATEAYEKGNPNLQKERGRHLELSGNWAQGESTFKVTAFASRYANYIALLGRTGANAQFNDNGELIDVFDFTAVPTEFAGAELSYQTAYRLGSGMLTPSVQYDLVRGKRTDGGGHLPRISPQRIVARMGFSQSGWAVTPEFIWIDHNKAAPGDVLVKGHELFNLRLSKSIRWNHSGGEVFMSLENLTNQLAFSATTFNSVRAYTPLGGRSALAGVKLVF